MIFFFPPPVLLFHFFCQFIILSGLKNTTLPVRIVPPEVWIKVPERIQNTLSLRGKTFPNICWTVAELIQNNKTEQIQAAECIYRVLQKLNSVRMYVKLKDWMFLNAARLTVVQRFMYIVIYLSIREPVFQHIFIVCAYDSARGVACFGCACISGYRRVRGAGEASYFWHAAGLGVLVGQG